MGKVLLSGNLTHEKVASRSRKGKGGAGDDNEIIPITVYQASEGRWAATVTAVKPGKQFLTINWDGVPIKGSPFHFYTT